MSEINRLSIRCWVDSDMENNVVTVRDASREEIDQIFKHASEFFPEGSFRRDGRSAVFIGGEDIIVHHYLAMGGELELVSHSLSHERLLEPIPESIRSKAGM